MNDLKITNIIIYRILQDDCRLAYASITINNFIVLNNIEVCQNYNEYNKKNGIYILSPAIKNVDAYYFKIIDNRMLDIIKDEISIVLSPLLLKMKYSLWD